MTTNPCAICGQDTNTDAPVCNRLMCIAQFAGLSTVDKLFMLDEWRKQDPMEILDEDANRSAGGGNIPVHPAPTWLSPAKMCRRTFRYPVPRD